MMRYQLYMATDNNLAYTGYCIFDNWFGIRTPRCLYPADTFNSNFYKYGDIDNTTYTEIASANTKEELRYSVPWLFI